MSTDGPSEWIVPTTGAKTLPAVDILTGRGFITGKSGSGKSNTASVIAEELLDNNYNLLIIDPEGEYYGLKEAYEMLHVGNDDLCDVQVQPKDADKIATLALERNVPIILDVSDFLDGEEAKRLIKEVVIELFQKEKRVRKPFLLMVEEMQEYLPQQGGSDELSEVLERVAKRGRKRGLGMLGMSQRPSSVDKDFITQCDWMVWHRLNWKNDLDVVKNILGKDMAADVENFEAGEGYLMTDWDDSVERVKFKKKKTHDGGATPGLESYERPDPKTVSSELVAAIEGDADIEDVPEQERIPQPSTSSPSPDSEGDDRDSTQEQGLTLDASGTSPFSDSDTGDDTGNEGSSGSQEVEGVGEGSRGIREPPKELPRYSAEELAELDSAALREHAQQLQEQNQLLRDEITELRDVLANAERAGTPSHARDSEPISEQESVTPPTKPVPPSEVSNESSVGGVLVEFTAMTGYLFRSLGYRWRLLRYRLAKRRQERRAAQRREADSPQDL